MLLSLLISFLRFPLEQSRFLTQHKLGGLFTPALERFTSTQDLRCWSCSKHKHALTASTQAAAHLKSPAAAQGRDACRSGVGGTFPWLVPMTCFRLKESGHYPTLRLIPGVEMHDKSVAFISPHASAISQLYPFIRYLCLCLCRSQPSYLPVVIPPATYH